MIKRNLKKINDRINLSIINQTTGIFNDFEQHGVLFLLFKKYQDSFFSKDVNLIKDKYRFNTAKNLLYLEWFSKIRSKSIQRKINVLPLKGISLLERVYSDIGLRPLNDIDLYVCRGHRPVLEKIITGFGFSKNIRYPDSFSKDNIKIDIHTNLINCDRLPVRQKLFNTECLLDGLILYKGKYFINPESEFIYLAIHLAIHHGFDRLIWFYDLYLLLHSRDFDFDKLHYLAEKSNSLKVINLTFYLLNIYQNIDKIENKLHKFNLRNEYRNLLKFSQLKYFKYITAYLFFDNLYDKIRYTRELILPSPQILKKFYFPDSEKNIISVYFEHLKNFFKIY